MTIKECYYQILDRLNKLNTNANKEITIQAFIRAMRKATLHYVRDRIKLGEATNTIVEDTQRLLVYFETTDLTDGDTFQEIDLPENWLRYGRIETLIEGCPNLRIYGNVVGETNANQFIDGATTETDPQWQECVVTIQNQKLRLYKSRHTPKPFIKVVGTYFRVPTLVNMFDGVTDINDIPTTDVESDFENDQLQLILDLTGQILASDIEDFDRMKTIQQSGMLIENKQ
jgi:hypothetical protein